MKTLVVYYSLEGNTRFVASQMAKELEADMLEIQAVKKYKSDGFMKSAEGLKDALAGEKPELELYSFRKEDYDCIVIGTPLWAGTCAPPILSFLTEENLSNVKLAFFVCCGGGPAAKCFEQMTELSQAVNPKILRLVNFLTKNIAENNLIIHDFCKQLQE